MSAHGKLRLREDGSYAFYCPGCKCYHAFNKHWDFDGNFSSPTISQSFLTTGYANDEPLYCHLYVRAGRLEFLSDCKHELVGQTVDMRDEE